MENEIMAESKNYNEKRDIEKESRDKPAQIVLEYDTNRWHEVIPEPTATLQLFITNKCNKRCNGCFYEHSLGKGEMSIAEYKSIVEQYEGKISKVILLGGEPTIHHDLKNIIQFNQYKNIKTTIYTNGFDLEMLEDIAKEQDTTNQSRIAPIKGVDTRIGILGLYRGEKHLAEVARTKLPVTIVYMLRKNNIDELMDTARYAQDNFDCRGFYISSIRDIGVSGSYWKDTEETISMEEYSQVIQDFVSKYDGDIQKIHISRRGILTTDRILKGEYPIIDSCRFINIFPDHKQIICPFDIAKSIYYTGGFEFYSRKCNKNSECLLQKIVLERNTT